MINYKNIHVCLMGYHKSINQYRILLDIYRENFSFGKDLWITSLYEGNEKLFISGLGENTYIKTNVSGYALGAIEQINRGLEFALASGRELIMIHNFDVMFFSEAGFNTAIQEFIDSGKQFSAAIDCNGLPATDIMIFNRSFLLKMKELGLFPFRQEHAKYREKLEIAERYKQTELGFTNVEEWIFKSFLECIWNFQISGKYDNEIVERNLEELDMFYKNFLLENTWHPMSRTDLPRLRWSDRLTLAHEHDIEEIKRLLVKYNLTKGNAIKYFLGR